MLKGFLVRCCRVQKMPYPPPIPLPVPAAVPPQPPDVAGVTLDALELMSEEEAQSNEQLYHSVSIQFLLCGKRKPICCIVSSETVYTSAEVLASCVLGTSQIHPMALRQ